MYRYIRKIYRNRQEYFWWWRELKAREKAEILSRSLFYNRTNSRPIFIVGCGNSGTSLMLRILGSHPSIYAIPHETNFLLDSGKWYKKAAIQVYIRLLDNVALVNGRKRWIEKTPRHVWRIDTIFSLRPSAFIVVMVRDPRDVVCSLMERGISFNDALERWKQDNECVRKYVGNSRIVLQKYEDLVAEPSKCLKTVCAALGEQFTEALLSYHERSVTFFQAEKDRDIAVQNLREYRNWQVNQPITNRSGRWKSELTIAQLVLVETETRELMEYFGYCSSDGLATNS